MVFVGYINRLKSILDRVTTEQAVAISAAGQLVATAVGNGAIVHVFGTGHSHMIAEEAFYRAGGLAAVNPILDHRLTFLEGALESTRAERQEGYALSLLSRERVERNDVAILISNSGRNSAPVEMALAMTSREIPVIAITNLTQSSAAASRHPSGKRLFEVSSLVIDTCVPDGDAVLQISGSSYPLGPASTVVGAAIINSVMIEAAVELLRNGKTVPVFPSANLGSTTEQTLKELFRPYSDRIRYLA
jgi:uncharacterized phosphosugar-binding protein